ncbi:molybdenum cofactor guanylyltransferase MobA [Roseibium suaedae]|uniref:Molybdenum cofactor guanylyltransferase n=1 Tax=Roseibium suaedae TaxID=735517 RepID=A0A1M7CQ08_9HYPH|nr:molybdenum cofactor guanylyltransferase MobA [Roseibium suaedae]SHL69376.1 molybdenum cofactor guanylyltransferase [Roseibium suaedae]
MIRGAQRPPSDGEDELLTLILAGGQSRRMGGGDKTLLPLGGKPMLSHILERLEGQSARTILNANGNPERFSGFGLPIIPDSIAGFGGPLAGILTGMLHARQFFPQVRSIVSVAADTPFFPRDLIARMKAAVPRDKPVIALATSSDRLHPVFGLWPVELADDLAFWLASGQNGKVLAWVDRHDSIEIDFGPDPLTGLDPFFNANRPEDLETARQALSQATA